MANRPYKLIVFDFDGTLVDAGAPIVAAMNHALENGGYPARSRDEIWAHVGTSLPLILDELSGGGRTPAELDALTRAYRAHFAEAAPGMTRLFDGVPEMIARLRGAGALLSVATNRGRASLEQILEAHDLAGAFSFLVGGYCVDEPKPHPEMMLRTLAHFGCAATDALMVGDTVHDMQMARAAGVDACAVTWGAHTEAMLRAESPRYVVHAPEKIGE